MKKRILLPLLLIVFCRINAEFYFYVQLKDKNNTPYSLNNPSDYLSQRAIDRRVYFNVPVDSADLPVNKTYLDQIGNFGIRVHCTTKWLNGVTVALADSSQMSLVRNLSFVKFVQYTGKTGASGSLISQRKLKTQAETTDYGSAAIQINQLNGSFLHDKGYRGQNMYIALIDAGFTNVNVNVAFDSLRNENRIVAMHDFVDPPLAKIYSDSHGANTLSTMAAIIPGTYVGTAPKASYLLIRTEAVLTENLCEPDFWISGIEFADSVGVDVSSTSLGYTEFDTPSMNYTHNALDGKTARASIAAGMAYKKGILLFNSSGNEGAKSWVMVSVPSDAENVICVGAVNSSGAIGSFSSYGTPYGNVKPELCAHGVSASILNTSGSVSYANGTSFACPILAGMSACYLQAAKAETHKVTLDEIRQNLYQSANRYTVPDTKMGYGIPDFQKAYNALNKTNIPTNLKDNVKIYTSLDKLHIVINENLQSAVKSLSLYSASGTVIYINEFKNNKFDVNTAVFPKGIYLLKLNVNNQIVTQKIILP